MFSFSMSIIATKLALALTCRHLIQTTITSQHHYSIAFYSLKCPEISIYILLLLLFSFLSYCIVSLLHFSSDICDLSNSLFSHYLSCYLNIFSIVITFADTLSHYISLSLSPSTPPSVSFISFLSLSLPFPSYFSLSLPLSSSPICLTLSISLSLSLSLSSYHSRWEQWKR